MSDAMRSFAFRRHARHEHKTVASFMCLVVTAITAAEFQCRCAKRSNVEALDAKCVMTNSLSLSTKHHRFVSHGGP